jgi:predicted house-cleaning NTP pyrophosphatase (Maf/HAM1 superfamily)
LGGVLVERIDGDYFCVIGMPIGLTVQLLEEMGRPYRFTL